MQAARSAARSEPQASEGSEKPPGLRAAVLHAGAEVGRPCRRALSQRPGSRSPLIGQGTWHFERGAAADRGRDAALARPRPRHDPHRHRRDVRRGAAEEIVGEAIAGRRDEVFLVSKVLPQNASRRGHDRRPASARSRASAPTGSTATCCTGAATHPLEETHRRLRAARARRQDPLLGRQQLRRGRPRGGARDRRRGPHRLQPGALPPASSAPSSTPCCPGARRTASRSSPTARSATATSRPRRRAAGACSRRSPAAHGATPRQVALAFLVRRPPLFTIPKASSLGHVEENAARGRAAARPRAEIARIDAAFPRGPARARCRRSSGSRPRSAARRRGRRTLPSRARRS